MRSVPLHPLLSYRNLSIRIFLIWKCRRMWLQSLPTLLDEIGRKFKIVMVSRCAQRDLMLILCNMV